MAVAPITQVDLEDRFPEMAGIDALLVSTILEEVHYQIGGQWPDELRAAAQLYMAAHLVASEGGLNRDLSAATVGALQSRKEGDVQVTFGPAGGGVVAYQQGKNYTSTPYGRRYIELVQVAFGGMAFTV